MGKVCERVVFNTLYRFASPFLTNQQSGFRKKDGTTLQLARLVEQWSGALDKGQYVGTVFFDLRKAFGRVWHKGLLVKLEAAGIKGSTLSWFSAICLTVANVLEWIILCQLSQLVCHKV